MPTTTSCRRGSRSARSTCGTRIGSPEALLHAIRDAAATTPAGEPIGGFGFDHGKYELPSLEALDDAAGEHPLLLFHISGHHVLVNSLVLRASRVDEATPDPPGGAFVRDAEGRPTGLCLDTACGVVVPTDVDIGSHGPNFHTRAPMAALVAAVERADRAFADAGLTTVCDAQVTAREMSAYRAAREAGARGSARSACPLAPACGLPRGRDHRAVRRRPALDRAPEGLR